MKPRYRIVIILVVVVIACVLGYVLLSSKTPTQTVPSETYGMSQYTDPTYGFSFWYPGALPVIATTANNSSEFPGKTAVEMLQVGPAGGVTIYVVNSPTSTITDEPAGHASPIAQTQYFYDSTSGQSRWIIQKEQMAKVQPRQHPQTFQRPRYLAS